MMNCHHFEKRLFEYIEGSLSRGERAQIEKHLARCIACREALEQERTLASALRERLTQSTGSLRLSPKITFRILAAAACSETRSRHSQLKWALTCVAMPALVIVVGALFWLGSHFFFHSQPLDSAQRTSVAAARSEEHTS